MNNTPKDGNNVNSQKIRKNLSSPNEAPKSAEAAFVGAFIIHYLMLYRFVFQQFTPYRDPHLTSQGTGEER